MKKILTLVSCLILVAGTQAKNGHENGKLYTYDFLAETTIQKLVINGNIKVTLIPSTSGAVQVVGKDQSVEKVITTFSKDGLFIDAPSYLGTKDVHVIIPIHMVNKIVVNGNADLKSQGYLQAKKIMVVVNGEAKISLQSVGTIDILEHGDFEVTVSNKRGDVNILKQ
jgi:hypothetical protein